MEDQQLQTLGEVMETRWDQQKSGGFDRAFIIPRIPDR